MSVWYPQNVSLAHTKEFRYQWKHWCFGFELYCSWFDWRYCIDFQNNQYRSRCYPYCIRKLLDKKSKRRNIELLDILSKGGAARTWLLFYCQKEGAERYMESMRDVDRVMEREIKKGSTPLQFEQLGFGDYSYNEITSQEKLLQVLSYLLRIGEYEPFAGKTIGNNVYMDMRGKKAVFKRTRLTYERNNIFATIKRLAKKYKPDYEGKVYLETVRCFFTISAEELEKCRYNYKGKDTYAFVMSDRYIMALYTYCLSARKAVALENIEMEGLSEAELSMVKLESVREVLFQALLLDDVKFEDGKMYAELSSIYLLC